MDLVFLIGHPMQWTMASTLSGGHQQSSIITEPCDQGSVTSGETSTMELTKVWEGEVDTIKLWMQNSDAHFEQLKSGDSFKALLCEIINTFADNW